jgi:hypothetical protein
VSSDNFLPDSPPPEVARAIAAASQVYQELNAHGQQIHFGYDGAEGVVTAELQDLDGNPLSTLSAGEALELADAEVEFDGAVDSGDGEDLNPGSVGP